MGLPGSLLEPLKGLRWRRNRLMNVKCHWFLCPTNNCNCSPRKLRVSYGMAANRKGGILHARASHHRLVTVTRWHCKQGQKAKKVNSLYALWWTTKHVWNQNVPDSLNFSCLKQRLNDAHMALMSWRREGSPSPLETCFYFTVSHVSPHDLPKIFKSGKFLKDF